MAHYLFGYHGGARPETPEAGEKAMAAWMAWFKDMGEAVIAPGNPVGPSRTVSASGVADDGGANPLSGYTVVSVDSFEAACALAAGCPIIDSGGSVEVAEIIEM